MTYGLQIMDLTALRYINRFSVAKGVPTDKTISYSTLADKLGVNESQLKRVLRYVMTKGIFAEDDGAVAHTITSRLLLNEGIATLSRYSSDRGWPIASRFNDAIDKWGHGAQEPNQTAFNVFKDTTLSMFEYHEQHPEFGADFHTVMQQFTKTPPMSHKHIKSAFEWSSLSHATIIDVGGSLGHGSIAILEENPTLTCIVQDLPKTVVQATNPATSIVPSHLADRISFQEHSFFDPQPVTADIYFLRMIFHDWADKYARTILQNLLVAMKPGARILIMDYVTLPFGTLNIADERRMRIRDMQMMVMHNALERDEGEWRQLLLETDPRLKLLRIRKPAGSALSLLEVVLDDRRDSVLQA
jgi:6-hydroxytryprostatin B O-methyltransferase